MSVPSNETFQAAAREAAEAQINTIATEFAALDISVSICNGIRSRRADRPVARS